IASGPATHINLDEVISKYQPGPDVLRQYNQPTINPPNPPLPPEPTLPRQDNRKKPRRFLTWMHGTPQVPFKPHQELDGVEFEMWNDDRLGFVPGDDIGILGNLGSQIGGWRPGDHRGCTCVIEI